MALQPPWDTSFKIKGKDAYMIHYTYGVGPGPGPGAQQHACPVIAGSCLTLAYEGLKRCI